MFLSRTGQWRGSADPSDPRQARGGTTENEAEVSSLLQDDKSPLDLKPRPNGRHGHSLDTAFGCPRNFLSSNRCVYTVVSPRAVGLSVGVNMNPDAHCNFDCLYCEVVRQPNVPRQPLAVDAMANHAGTRKSCPLLGEAKRKHPARGPRSGAILDCWVNAPGGALSKRRLTISAQAFAGGRGGGPDCCAPAHSRAGSAGRIRSVR